VVLFVVFSLVVIFTTCFSQWKFWILWDYPVIRTGDVLEVVVDKVIKSADGALLDEPFAFEEGREKK